MITLKFVTGGALRKVFIKGREISILTEELGHTPLTINLEKLDEPENKKRIKEARIDEKTLKELLELKTEEEIAKDITKDFQKSGWRLFRRE